jgi:hypothetical protein
MKYQTLISIIYKWSSLHYYHDKESSKNISKIYFQSRYFFFKDSLESNDFTFEMNLFLCIFDLVFIVTHFVRAFITIVTYSKNTPFIYNVYGMNISASHK